MFLQMWLSRTEAPAGCAVLTGAGLSPGRMPVFLLRCANRGNRQKQCRHCHARDEIPTLSSLVFRMSGCQLSSMAVPREHSGHSWSPVPVSEPGLCSRAISWQVVPGVPCPVQMCLSLCASPARSASEPGGCRWPPEGSVEWEVMVQARGRCTEPC